MAATFLPVRPIDGYLPIEDHGLIGDGTTAALVGRDAAIDWMCIPRFDSAPLFCRILDAKRGGAIVAAPTSSLPEAIGGVRNWDYRYAWIRDAAFSVYALRRIGVVHEAANFLGWVLDAAERTGRPRVLYDSAAVGSMRASWRSPCVASSPPTIPV